MLKETAAVAALISCCFCLCASAAGNIEITNTGISVDGNSHEFSYVPFKQDGDIYVPLDEAMPACGYTLGWNNGIRGTVCRKDGSPESVVFPTGDTHLIGYGMYRYIHPVINLDGKCFINMDLFADVSGTSVTARADIQALRIPNKHRITENEAVQYGQEIVLNRDYIFEPVVISPKSTVEYAKIVNMIAERVPEVNVYNMLIPDSGEFYAPEKYYCNQNAALESVFDKLHNVTPVRTSNILYEHADENIYFRTDHHWTQRGAYYAWKAFMDIKGESVPELSEFKTSNTECFTGYFAKNLSGTSAEEALDDIDELLERFLPRVNASAKIYDDMYQKEFAASTPVINTAANHYGTFLYGDCPLTVITGGVKNGKKLVIFKESMGNALAVWAPNNYETTYVVDIRHFTDGSFDIAEFYELNHFDDLLIESYPTTIESADLRAGLASLAGNE